MVDGKARNSQNRSREGWWCCVCEESNRNRARTTNFSEDQRARVGGKVSGRMTISCTEQYLFKFLPPSGPPPHACMLAAGTHPNRRVALVQIVAARCTEPDEHELGSVSVPLS